MARASLVAGALIGRLVLQVRSQAADLAAVAEIANGISGDSNVCSRARHHPSSSLS